MALLRPAEKSQQGSALLKRAVSSPVFNKHAALSIRMITQEHLCSVAREASEELENAGLTSPVFGWCTEV